MCGDILYRLWELGPRGGYNNITASLPHTVLTYTVAVTLEVTQYVYLTAVLLWGRAAVWWDRYQLL